ncbi:hypothetical protein [Magnetospira sp. QH-2]|uniref:hypothetical protein n=1 Tax=Magnetospira sp. (strain QH-2) TaxID=1288970 RepID=UPI0005F9EB03|nr:hypothetical protein [Magnetospira sp. QH-2]
MTIKFEVGDRVAVPADTGGEIVCRITERPTEETAILTVDSLRTPDLYGYRFPALVAMLRHLPRRREDNPS